jgi:hypothetical protein
MSAPDPVTIYVCTECGDYRDRCEHLSRRPVTYHPESQLSEARAETERLRGALRTERDRFAQARDDNPKYSVTAEVFDRARFALDAALQEGTK